MDAKTIRQLLREKFIDCAVVVKPTEYTYLHHDTGVFENRTVPAFKITVKGKKIVGYTTRNVRAIYNTPDESDVRNFLREADYCAECLNHGLHIMNVEKDRWPVNIVYDFGIWHKRTQDENHR
jgi:hypothetical protein